MAVETRLESCRLISRGEVDDMIGADELLEGLGQGAVIIADKGDGADRVSAQIRAQGTIPNIPNRSNRNTKCRRKKAIYPERNHVERIFNKLKRFRCIASLLRQARVHFLCFYQARSHANLAPIN